mmetsp:Transcript_26022/g.38529  ORF Transcript_26022/g.38529 Transcript_26022/m.38529 type:complete len:87 (+) Transcript_26022:45-305(+)
MMRGRAPPSLITHTYTDSRIDEIILPPLGKRNVLIDVKCAKQCDVLPGNVPNGGSITSSIRILLYLEDEYPKKLIMSTVSLRMKYG